MTTDVIQVRMRSAILKNIEDPAKRGATRPKTSMISGREDNEFYGCDDTECGRRSHCSKFVT